MQRTEAKAEQYEARASRAMHTVNLLKQGIQLTFDKLGCNKEAVTAVLGNQGVTESNIMQVTCTSSCPVSICEFHTIMQNDAS